MIQRMDQTKSCKFVVYSKTFLHESDGLVYIETVPSPPLLQLTDFYCIPDVTNNCCT